MKRIGGWIVGGAETVIQALLDVLGSSGTLMMPTHTTDNSDPARWQNPPMPKSWWQPIREATPAFRPEITETRNMGVIPEQFRRYPGVIRSAHPIGSFAAYGRYAHELTANHDYRRHMFGEESPIGQLYALDGWVLLLGVSHLNNTSLHLAEYRAHWDGKMFFEEGSAIWVDGMRQWVTYPMMHLNTDDFDLIGRAYEQSVGYLSDGVGLAETRYLRQRPLVDFAVNWIEAHR
jgi:aminoglycoside 3-N-acetyltransferase